MIDRFDLCKKCRGCVFQKEIDCVCFRYLDTGRYGSVACDYYYKPPTKTERYLVEVLWKFLKEKDPSTYCSIIKKLIKIRQGV